jgi:acetoin utilization deacetylase AcuC-like enzyme
MRATAWLRPIRQRLRWLHRLFRRPAAQFVYDLRYQHSVSGVPLDPLRAERILTFLLMERLIHGADVLHPLPVSLDLVRDVHSDAYLEALDRPGALSPILGIDVPDRDHHRVLLLQRLMVGGTIQAAELARSGEAVGVNLGGGFHHARPERGGGFCVFNDVAIAVAHLRRTGLQGKILVVDLDLHDGEGTRQCFAKDESVHTLSIHNRTLCTEPAVASTVVELGSAVRDEQYLAAIREHLPRAIEQTDPSMVFYVAGTDPADGDELGDWKISARGMLERSRIVLSLLRGERRCPLAVVLGGGYGPEAWRPSARFFSLLLSGRLIEPRTTEELTMVRFRFLARQLQPAELMGGPDALGERWTLSEEDVLAGLDPHGPQNRLLGYYSAEGVELALERYSVLAQVRAYGFPSPSLVLDFSDSERQKVRVFGDDSRRELLMDLFVHLDLRTIPDMELLAIDWLLLQNPRAAFSPERPPLPGQEHPGLGLLTEVVGMLVLVCERLNLDGLLYVPSHYHLAALSARRGLRFLSAAHQAQYERIERHTSSMGFAEVSWAAEDGRLTDPGTGEPFAWKGEPMVLPVSERLKRHLAQGVAAADEAPAGGEPSPVEPKDQT